MTIHATAPEDTGRPVRGTATRTPRRAATRPTEPTTLPIALIALGDRLLQSWGPRRWFERAGFRVELTGGAAEALHRLERLEPAVLIVEAALRRGAHPLYDSLVERGKPYTFPLLVMCANRWEERRALEAGVTDIVRWPYDWQLTSRRAALLVESLRSTRQLERARRSLDRMLAHAELVAEPSTPSPGAPDGSTVRELVTQLLSPRPGGPPTVLLLLDADGLASLGALLEHGERVLTTDLARCVGASLDDATPVATVLSSNPPDGATARRSPSGGTFSRHS